MTKQPLASWLSLSTLEREAFLEIAQEIYRAQRRAVKGR